MAFGGVATGSIKAQLAARQTGTVKDTGRTPMPTATAPNTGRKVEVVATLLVTSVKKIINAATANIRNIGGTVLSTLKPSPIQMPRPLEFIWAAIDKPPPNKINNPHGNLSESLQSKSSPLFEVDGIINKRMAEIIAMPASVRPENIW